MTTARTFGATPGDVAAAVQRLDAIQRTFGQPIEARADYKEWFHFCVRLPGGHLIVNFSLVERVGALRTWSEAVLTVLSTWPSWRGFVRRYPVEAVRARAGELQLRMGPHAFQFVSGAFVLSIDDERLQLSARLVPRVWPTLSRLGLGAGSSRLEWVIVPRLEASGHLRVDDRSLRFDGAAAYHDHNWGRFRWGAELAWEWGFVLSDGGDEPWTMVFSRLMDHGASRTFSQGALLWRGPEHVRTFHDREIEIARADVHVPAEPPLTVPPVCGLIVPGAASGVPARFALRASGIGDELRLDFATASHARIVLPSEDDGFEVTVVNEAIGAAAVQGHVGDETFGFQAPAIMEFVRAA
jgi:hypothetical protein